MVFSPELQFLALYPFKQYFLLAKSHVLLWISCHLIFFTYPVTYSEKKLQLLCWYFYPNKHVPLSVLLLPFEHTIFLLPYSVSTLALLIVSSSRRTRSPASIICVCAFFAAVQITRVPSRQLRSSPPETSSRLPFLRLITTCNTLHSFKLYPAVAIAQQFRSTSEEMKVSRSRYANVGRGSPRIRAEPSPVPLDAPFLPTCAKFWHFPLPRKFVKVNEFAANVEFHFLFDSVARNWGRRCSGFSARILHDYCSIVWNEIGNWIGDVTEARNIFFQSLSYSVLESVTFSKTPFKHNMSLKDVQTFHSKVLSVNTTIFKHSDFDDYKCIFYPEIEMEITIRNVERKIISSIVWRFQYA